MKEIKVICCIFFNVFRNFLNLCPFYHQRSLKNNFREFCVNVNPKKKTTSLKAIFYLHISCKRPSPLQEKIQDISYITSYMNTISICNIGFIYYLNL